MNFEGLNILLNVIFVRNSETSQLNNNNKRQINANSPISLRHKTAATVENVSFKM